MVIGTVVVLEPEGRSQLPTCGTQAHAISNTYMCQHYNYVHMNRLIIKALQKHHAIILKL